MTTITPFDILLGAGLLGLAGFALWAPDRFKGVVVFMVFGLLMALAWIRLGAVDIALAEAAIGAGITGALLLATLGRLESSGRSGAPAPTPRLAAVRPAVAVALLVLAAAMAALTVVAAHRISGPDAGLGDAVRARMDQSGVDNPVTAVILNFRGYDTLLEIGVLLIALWGAQVALGSRPARAAPFPGFTDDMLRGLVRLLAPLFVLVAGYLLWAGAHKPGGAFQAGAVLAALGIMLLLSGLRLPAALYRRPGRYLAALGFMVFLAVALAGLAGGQLLEYPAGAAGRLIFLIEGACAVSIGLILMKLFAACAFPTAGSQPAASHPEPPR
jgi:multisubunit Na+/H+ antiporter MnhB subunit